MNEISVSFIGAGNVAWHLAPALDNVGIVVREVYSRNRKNAKELNKKLYQARDVSSLDFSKSPSNLFIIAVPDEVIHEIVNDLILPMNSIIVHTSASQSAGILGYHDSERFGVFYPLQTFSKLRRVNLESIPILIETEDRYTMKTLKEIAGRISNTVMEVDGNTRRSLHLAAVFANNFTNHMLKISEDISKAHDIPFKLLAPLIRETFSKALEIGPSNSQTGPARRHDFSTLDKHLSLLADNDELSEIYQTISQHIVDTFSDEYEEED